MARTKGTNARQKVMLQKVAEGVVAGKTQVAIARELSVNTSTIYRMERLPEFQPIVDEMVAERRRRTLMQMEVMSALALKVHMDLMQDPAHRERLSAAESILDRVGQGRSHKVQQTTSAVVHQTTTIVDDFRGRSVEDLEHYAQHGRFLDGS
jgi:hypothetical protein